MLTTDELRDLRRTLEWDFVNVEGRSDRLLGGPNLTKRCAYCGEYYDQDKPFQGHRNVGGVADCMNRLMWDWLEQGGDPGNGGDPGGGNQTDILATFGYTDPAPTNDLNVLTRGRWVVAAPQNGPSGVSGALLVDSSFDPTSPGRSVQKAVRPNGTAIYHRTHDGSAWTVWRRTDPTPAPDVEDALIYKTGAPSQNLNALERGRWILTAPTNGPSGEAGPFLVDTGRDLGSSAISLQVVTRADGARAWRRTFNGTSWGAWEEIAGTTTTSAPPRLFDTSPPTTNLDNLESGDWRVDAATGAPFSGNWLVQSWYSAASPANGYQRVIRPGNELCYERTHDGSAWRPWRVVYNDAPDPLYYTRNPPTTDLNALPPGRWITATYTNGPAGLSGNALIDSGFDPAAPYAAEQHFTLADGTERWTRTWTGAAWTAWKDKEADSGGGGTTTGGGGVTEGTAFPASPTNGDRFHRTDLMGTFTFRDDLPIKVLDGDATTLTGWLAEDQRQVSVVRDAIDTSSDFFFHGNGYARGIPVPVGSVLMGFGIRFGNGTAGTLEVVSNVSGFKRNRIFTFSFTESYQEFDEPRFIAAGGTLCLKGLNFSAASLDEASISYFLRDFYQAAAGAGGGQPAGGGGDQPI